ncbi:hypothetical protein BZG36_04183 [Bifiguratus adelaidae]|uniref:pyridoxal kinase n=1 Tax=Bifiguratus adelaidae TaxID=1938954 RepID=A0A261XYU7_9FUNG|nr:hypothetical protein BZG36_04183 [Bifiguratus adelaidae]
MEKRYRVCTVQSHVVSGYCGNKAATFPMQLLGFDVDILNTVEFSNHTGFPVFTGKRTPPEEIKTLIDGLNKNGLTKAWTHVLTGYIGLPETLSIIKNAVESLKEQKPDLIWVCDPVMGDNGQLYVPEAVIPLYRSMIGVADLITPNLFEAEIITDIKITSLATAKQAMAKMHYLGCPNVLITSMSLPAKDIPNGLIAEDNIMYCMGSTLLPGNAGVLKQPTQFLISFPRYSGYFTGTGDVLAAVLTARYQHALDAPASHTSETPLLTATLAAIKTLNAIIKRTFDYQQIHVSPKEIFQINSPDRLSRPASAVHRCELHIIQSKDAIDTPPDTSLVQYALV